MDPITFINAWIAIRPFHRLKLRREARQAAEAGAIPLPEPTTEHAPEHVDAVVKIAATIVGGAKSKLIWLAAAQFLYALVVLYINDGALTMQSVEPLVTGFFTATFRIFTGQTLAEKGA